MKKIFALTASNKTKERVLESIKNDIRKYIKREKRKPLPENKNFWSIDCKFAKNDAELQEIRFEDIMKNINEASQENCESFHIELIANPIKKEPKIIETEIEAENITIPTQEEIQDAPSTK
ncbi:MAG: DUF6172 family protein [Campylobacterota bacterium]|nr:DUF6172 family protein [Campylobacterota bacterium]